MMKRREKRREKRNKQTNREGSQAAIAPSTSWCFGQLLMTSLLEEGSTVNGFLPAFPHRSENQTFMVEHSCIGLHEVATDLVFEVEA
jgi:hypothetical protein